MSQKIQVMNLADQLKNLFPDHEPLPEEKVEEVPHELYVQKEPMICKFEKEKAKQPLLLKVMKEATKTLKS